LVVVLMAVGCSGTGGKGSGSGSTPPAGATTPSTAATTTRGDPEPAATPAPTTTVPVADVAAGVNWRPSTAAPATQPTPSYDLITASAGRPAGPRGHQVEVFPSINGVFAAAGATFVAAQTYFNAGRSGVIEVGVRVSPFLFRSADGVNWTRVDLSALGDVDGTINSVIDDGRGAIATVTVTDPAHRSPTRVVVLTTLDGLTWSRRAEIVGPAAIRAGDLFRVGDSLVLAGFDDACSFDGRNVRIDVAPALQTRLWASHDGGTTWIDIPKSDGALDVKELPPIDPSLCPSDSDQIGERSIRFGSTPRAIGVFGGRLVIWSADGARIASTADGTTWQQSTLDEAPADTFGSALLDVDGEIVALSLQRPRRADGSQTPIDDAFQVESWRSTDSAAWRHQPAGRPFVVDGASVSASGAFTVAVDGTIHLAVLPSLRSDVAVPFASVQGPPEDWRSCILAAAAKCSFAEQFGAVEPGADLDGIDLRGALIGAIDLTGAHLSNADLSGAELRETIIAGADFANTDMDAATIHVDLTGISLLHTSVNGVTTDGRFFDAMQPPTIYLTAMTFDVSTHPIPAGTSLVGVLITATTFQGVSAIGALVGIDFSGAVMSSVSFVNVDLTGATFTGTDLSSVTFDSTTVCPDGLAPDPDGTAGAACRL